MLQKWGVVWPPPSVSTNQREHPQRKARAPTSAVPQYEGQKGADLGLMRREQAPGHIRRPTQILSGPCNPKMTSPKACPEAYSALSFCICLGWFRGGGGKTYATGVPQAMYWKRGSGVCVGGGGGSGTQNVVCQSNPESSFLALLLFSAPQTPGPMGSGGVSGQGTPDSRRPVQYSPGLRS